MNLLSKKQKDSFKDLLEASNKAWQEASLHRAAYEKLMQDSSDRISEVLSLVHDIAKTQYKSPVIDLIIKDDIISGVSIYVPDIFKLIKILYDGSVIYEES